MKWNELQNVTDNNMTGKDGYTTFFRSSITIQKEETHKFFRIEFRINNNCSSSWDDRSLEYLTKDGWVTIGTDKSITMTWDKSFQSDVRLTGIQQSCDNWTNSCKEYIEQISVAL